MTDRTEEVPERGEGEGNVSDLDLDAERAAFDKWHGMKKPGDTPDPNLAELLQSCMWRAWCARAESDSTAREARRLREARCGAVFPDYDVVVCEEPAGHKGQHSGPSRWIEWDAEPVVSTEEKPAPCLEVDREGFPRDRESRDRGA
jgi:hypothetical protein